MRLWVIVFKIKYTTFIDIDNMGILVFVVAFVPLAVVHMHVSMNKEFRFIFFQKGSEYLKTLMG